MSPAPSADFLRQLADHGGPSNSGRPATPAVRRDQLPRHRAPTRFQSTPSWCRAATRPRPERPPSSHKARLWAYHAKLECRRDSDWFQGDQSGFAPATTCSSCSALVDYRLATLVVSPPGQLDLASATSSLASGVISRLGESPSSPTCNPRTGC